MDVKYAVLHGVLKEEVYVEQSPGYEVVGEERSLWAQARSKGMV